jgi:hypothetical protein
VAVLAPLLLLLAYGLAFAAAALGVGLAVFDDHPGQLYRVWHVVSHGWAPWAWNFGWWTGYPELQFYPPAFAYAGALLHAASLGALGVPAAYQSLLWVAYLAPGVTAWVALARVLGNGWLALPGAFVALTLSLWPALMSGVEGGVRVGMAPARLGWALLPLLIAALLRWSEGAGRFPARAVVPLLAAVVLTHPAHLPAALAVVALAALAGPRAAPRLTAAAAWPALAALLTAFWTLPLLLRLADTRALAWGTLTAGGLAATLLAHPLVVALLLLAGVAHARARDARERLVVRLPLGTAAVVAVDALVLERLGLAWLPADRVIDGFWLSLVLAGGLGAARLVEGAAARWAVPAPALALGAVAVAVGLSALGRETLTLWPRPAAWPTHAETERGLRLPALWAALRAAPEGRVLFVRSAVPLAFAPDWWRPHTHVTALAPVAAGRAIVHGTFTHPSPVAALVYRGDAGPGAITSLAERLDGHRLFGQALDGLDAEAFNRHARHLRVAAVVALDEDLPRLGALADNADFPTRRHQAPFVVWTGRPAPLPQPLGHGRWRVTLAGEVDGWRSTGVAHYPLWRAAALGRSLPTRRGAAGDLQVRAGAVSAVELTYAAGWPETVGVAVSALALALWAGLAWRRRPAT